MTYSTGDRVRYTGLGANMGETVPVGAIGTVVRYVGNEGEPYVQVLFDNGDQPEFGIGRSWGRTHEGASYDWNLWASNVEPATPRVGDTVRITSNSHPPFHYIGIGNTAEVLAANSEDSWVLRSTEPLTDGRGGPGTGPSYREQLVNPANFVLVGSTPVTPEPVQTEDDALEAFKRDVVARTIAAVDRFDLDRGGMYDFLTDDLGLDPDVYGIPDAEPEPTEQYATITLNVRTPGIDGDGLDALRDTIVRLVERNTDASVTDSDYDHDENVEVY